MATITASIHPKDAAMKPVDVAQTSSVAQQSLAARVESLSEHCNTLHMTIQQLYTAVFAGGIDCLSASDDIERCAYVRIDSAIENGHVALNQSEQLIRELRQYIMGDE